MRHYCIQVSSRAIYLCIEQLYPIVKVALLERVKELTESGQVSGVQSDIDEYVGVDVEVYEEAIGHYRTHVFNIVSFFKYSK